MKIKVFILFFILNTSIVFTQVLDSSNPEVRIALNDGNFESSPLSNFFQKRTPMMDQLFQNVKDDDGIETYYVGAEIGSAYADETFKRGKIFYNENELGEVYYRLNAFNHEIELKKTQLDEEKEMALIKNEEVKLITNSEELVYRTFKDDKGKSSTGYLYLLSKGKKYTLYKRLYKKFTEPRPASNSMVNPIPSRFTDYTEFYFKKVNTNEIIEVPKTRGKIIKLFQNGLKISLKEHVKTNNLDLKNEKDLVELFNIIEKNKL
jgi:hypothetical protein